MKRFSFFIVMIICLVSCSEFSLEGVKDEEVVLVEEDLIFNFFKEKLIQGHENDVNVIESFNNIFRSIQLN